MSLALRVLIVASCLTSGLVSAQELKSETSADPFAKWEKEIARIEASDAERKPAKGCVVFVGSSSIRLWKIERNFPKLDFVNHGFGGSQIADSVHFFDRLVAPLEPRTVVFYAGDNDLAGGKTVAAAHADFEAFLKKFEEKLPQAKLVYIAVKPSPSRFKLFEKQTELNSLIRKSLDKDSQRFTFADIVGPMLNEKGEARPELFVKDMLHMNEAGYDVWTKVLEPLVK